MFAHILKKHRKTPYNDFMSDCMSKPKYKDKFDAPGQHIAVCLSMAQRAGLQYERVGKMGYAEILKTPGGIGNKNAAGPHKPFTRGKDSSRSAPQGQSETIPRTATQEKRHQKDLASDNWHTRTMAQFKDKSNAALEFIRQDAAAAAKANPDNPKAGQYMDEVHYASMELAARAKHRAKKADSGLFGIYAK